ncbi:MAG: diguanylate cyclase [Candidatus Aenigmarchaeota archaeon ex4484_52]|nr:MAG: diguanylate cyclase [Candidatus Aenigmarchaeota archaeon ex4484_52]
MKIIISSTGDKIDDLLDARFGRCPYFIVVEIENKKIKTINAIKNIAMAQMTGAGINAAQIVANENPDAIITTNIGPRAFDVFEQFNILIYCGSGKIKDVIQEFIDGKLTQIKQARGGMGFGFGKGFGRGGRRA